MLPWNCRRGLNVVIGFEDFGALSLCVGEIEPVSGMQKKMMADSTTKRRTDSMIATEQSNCFVIHDKSREPTYVRSHA